MNTLTLAIQWNVDVLGLRVLGFLSVLVLALWALARALPRLRRRWNEGGTRHVRVLERTWVENRRSLLVVEFEDRRFLIGSSEAGFEVLGETIVEEGEEDSP